MLNSIQNYGPNRAHGQIARMAKSRAWEVNDSNEWELWSEDSQENRDRCLQARKLHETDPEAEFLILRELADTGSVWPMELTARCFAQGSGVAADPELALKYYRRAFRAGSWMATIKFAMLAERLGQHDDWPGILEDGIEKGFVPASYWMASLRLKQSHGRKTRQEIKPMLEYASGEGHPAAQFKLSRMMALGKFGLREIPRGFRLGRQSISSVVQDLEADSAPEKSDSA